MNIQRTTVDLLFRLKDKTHFQQLEILQTHLNNMTNYGPIGSPRAMSYEQSGDPAYEQPEPEPEPETERQFAERMLSFFQKHPGDDIDGMTATIQEIKQHYKIQ